MENNNLVDKRLKLHNILKDIMSSYSSGPKDNRVWFKPDSNVNLKYPCIIYERGDDNSIYADNVRYFNTTNFRLNVIDIDSDSEVVNDIMDKIQSSSRQNEYVADGLYHYIINIPNGVL